MAGLSSGLEGDNTHTEKMTRRFQTLNRAGAAWVCPHVGEWWGMSRGSVRNPSFGLTTGENCGRIAGNGTLSPLPPFPTRGNTRRWSVGLEMANYWQLEIRYLNS